MYDADPFRDRLPGPWRSPYDPAPSGDRLLHLVFVDGRLVDTWSEPVQGTAWQVHADRFDAERRPAAPPPVPAHQRVLSWLDATCGGRPAVLALDEVPLSGDGLDLPEVAVDAHRIRLERAAELLDAVSRRWFDAETSFALRRALLVIWHDDPDTVVEARSAEVLAGGICWAVGKANGLFRPQGDLTVQRINDTIDSRSNLSTYGQRVRSVLLGFRSWPPDPVGSPRIDGVPDLQPLGHHDLLLGAVRTKLVRLRDRALAAQSEDEFYRAG